MIIYKLLHQLIDPCPVPAHQHIVLLQYKIHSIIILTRQQAFAPGPSMGKY